MKDHLLTVEARDVQELLRGARTHGFHKRGLIRGNDADSGLLGVLMPRRVFVPPRSERDRAQTLENLLGESCDALPGDKSWKAARLLGLRNWESYSLKQRRAGAYGSSAEDSKAAETFQKYQEEDLYLDVAIELLEALDGHFAVEEAVAQLELDFRQPAPD